MNKCQQCSGPFKSSSRTRHKKFCSERCRNEWWKGERKRAFGLLREEQRREAEEEEKKDRALWD